MKILPCALLLACFATAASAAEPKIATPTPDVDLGVLLEGEKRTQAVRIENQGDADLAIMRVHPSCGCTVARLLRGDTGEEITTDPLRPLGVEPVAVLKPGEHLQVEVTYNSLGQPHRRITKYFEVFSNDPAQERLRIHLSVEIRKAYTVKPNPLQLGSAVFGAGLKGQVVLTVEPGVTMNVTGVQAVPGLLSTVTPLEDSERPAWRIDVEVPADAPVGHVSRTLAILTDHPSLSSVRVPVLGEVQPRLSVDTHHRFNRTLLDFETIAAGQAATRGIDVVCAAEGVACRVTGVTVDAGLEDLIEARVETLEEGRSYRVDVTARPDIAKKFFRGSLRVHTDLPEQPEVTIAVMGRVKS